MNLYQITDLAGNRLDDVRGHISATDHRAAALAVSVDIVAFDLLHGRRNIGPNVDMDYGHHYVDMIGNREIVVTDVEDATDTRPDPELVEGDEDDPFDGHAGMGLDTAESLNAEALAEVEMEERRPLSERLRAEGHEAFALEAEQLEEFARDYSRTVSADHPAIQAAMARKTRPVVAPAAAQPLTVADLDKGDSATIAEGKFEGRAFTVHSKGTMGRFVMVDWTEQGTRGSIAATTEVTR